MRSLNYNQEPDGKVYLVGAGPGDFKLITLKAGDVSTEDVIFYNLIKRELFPTRNAECFYVATIGGARTAKAGLIERG